MSHTDSSSRIRQGTIRMFSATSSNACRMRMRSACLPGTLTGTGSRGREQGYHRSQLETWKAAGTCAMKR